MGAIGISLTPLTLNEFAVVSNVTPQIPLHLNGSVLSPRDKLSDRVARARVAGRCLALRAACTKAGVVPLVTRAFVGICSPPQPAASRLKRKIVACLLPTEA
jgi:hypothetical protein